MPTDITANPQPGDSQPARAEMLICTKCRAGGPLPEDDGDRPGARLHRALAERDLPAGVTLTAVECLSNCSQGCSMVLRGPGRWTYVYGNLAPETHVETVLDGVARYCDAADGLVPWRERPEHFRKNCIARIPPLES